jgi:hypothetical protein
MKNLLYFALLFTLCSCAMVEGPQVSKNDIIISAKRTFSKHEHWNKNIYCEAYYDGTTWLVRANAIDPKPTKYGSILFVPGKGREIWYTKTGKLIKYGPTSPQKMPNHTVQLTSSLAGCCAKFRLCLALSHAGSLRSHRAFAVPDCNHAQFPGGCS